MEAIPETLQILPVENEVMEDVENEAEHDITAPFENAEELHEHINEENELQTHTNNPVYVKEEQFINEEQNPPKFDEEGTFEEELDSKEGNRVIYFIKFHVTLKALL